MPYLDGLRERNAGERIGRHRLAGGEFGEDAVHHRLDGGEHVFLGDEAHLDVELVELQRAIGAQVLVAETGRDLEVAVEAGDHQQLLELLRRLGKRVELARMDARGDQKVARALGAGRGQDRGLELGEPLVDHPAADRIDHLRAQDDVAMQGLAPQVEVAVRQSDLFGIVRLAEHRQGQLGGLGKHLDARTRTSISPVGRPGLMVSPVRATTSPSMRTTLSARSRSRVANPGAPG